MQKVLPQRHRDTEREGGKAEVRSQKSQKAVCRKRSGIDTDCTNFTN